METVYSLAYLTAAPAAPPDVIAIAGKVGYQAVGLRIAPSAPGGDFSPLIEDAALRRETIARCKDTGVAIFDIEIARLGAGFELAAFDRFLAVAAELGARTILVAGDDPDEARLVDSFAAFCDAAAKYNLMADLEFMPWTAVADANTALRVIEKAGRANARVLVDALHAARSDTSLADIAAIPRNRLNYAQLCDAPAEIPATVEGLIYTARCERLLPGEGGIDLVGMLRQLPADLPLSIEIPHEVRLPALGAEEWARQALAASKRVVAEARAQGAAR